MKYLFFTSFLKVKEKSLPQESDLEKMLSSATLDQALGVLKNTLYGKINPNNLEKELNQSRKESLKELKKLELDEKVINLIFLKEDLIDIALFLKHKLFDFEIPLDEEKIKELKERYPELVEKEFDTPYKIDDFLAEFYFEEMIRRVKSLKAKHLKNFLKEYKDASTNAKKKSLEEDFIKKAENEIAGIDPIFAFFLKKGLIEKELRNIIGGKRLGLEEDEIRKKRTNLNVIAFN